MEHVGQCTSCGKNVYCRDGFLDGYVDEEHQLFCNDCEIGKKEAKETPEEHN